MIILRAYQKSALDFLRSTKRGILQAPAGSGKTITACAAIAAVLERRERETPASIEILCPTRDIVEQWQGALSKFPIIGEKASIAVFCGPSAPWGTQPDLLIVDEAHRSAAKTWRRKIESVTGARWGLSATPWADSKYRNDTVRRLFGDRIHEIERDALVDAGHLAKAKVRWLPVPSSKELEYKIEQLGRELIAKRKKRFPGMFRNPVSAKKQEGQALWPAVEKHGLEENPARNSLIVEEATKLVRSGHSVIILIKAVEHGRNLAERIPGAVPAYSGMGGRKRRETLQGFRNGDIRCLVATSLLDEGFDAPIADALIVAVGGRSFRKTVQSSGRILRPFDGKEHGLIIDFDDQTHGMLKAQARKRRAIYEDLGYEQETENTTPSSVAPSGRRDPRDAIAC
jgi:superfamily II DNA or RNA helicase